MWAKEELHTQTTVTSPNGNQSTSQRQISNNESHTWRGAQQQDRPYPHILAEEVNRPQWSPGKHKWRSCKWQALRPRLANSGQDNPDHGGSTKGSTPSKYQPITYYTSQQYRSCKMGVHKQHSEGHCSITRGTKYQLIVNRAITTWGLGWPTAASTNQKAWQGTYTGTTTRLSHRLKHQHKHYL